MPEPAVTTAQPKAANAQPRTRPPAPAPPTRAPAGIPPAVGPLGLRPSSGTPLPPVVARPLEKRLGVDLTRVRVHTDEHAAEAARAVSARAFTVGDDIFLAAGERVEPGNALIAHEVAHTIQQRTAPRPQPFTDRGGDRYEHEARSAAAAVTRGESFTVGERTPTRLQRLGLSDALDYFADKANLIPGFRMFTIILGVNPVNMSRVERSAANILRAVIEFIPGGGLITQALDNYGVFERVGAWVEQQIRTLGMTGSIIRDAIDRFLDSLSWTDIFDLGGVWNRAKRIFSEPIDRILSFLGGLVTGIVTLIKDAILRPLAELAKGTRGWDLLTAVIGRDPITGDPVPRTPDTLIGGFMKLIGQDEVWQNIKRANAIPRAWAWFQGALSSLVALVSSLPSRFLAALRDLVLEDIVFLVGAFTKVGRVFASFIGDFLSWAGQQVMKLLEIIFEVLAPAVMPYLRKAMGAFRTIIANPIGFIGNLVRAGVQGFRQFASGFLGHLRRSLIEWLTGTLSGAAIYIPQAFELREIIKFVLSVLGLTWQNIRGKLVRVIGETAMGLLEQGFDVVMTLVREGPAAAWEKIRESIGNLRDMVMGQVMEFVQTRIVQAAITRLVTSLNPAGAFIQAIIAIYNTVMFVVERLRQIGQVVASFIDSISAIAAGAVGAAANRVEQTMGGLLTLVISFLARLVGLGNVSEIVLNVVRRIREPIDRAIDRVVEWVVAQARRLGKLVAGAAARVAGWLGLRRQFRTVGGASHTLLFRRQGDRGQLAIRSAEMALEPFLDDLATKYTRDATKLARVRAAQALVAEIRRMTDPANAPATTSADVDTRVQAKVDMLAPILVEIGDGVTTEGARAAYRGMHWWVTAGASPAAASADPVYLANLARQDLNAQQLSDAVRSLLERTTPGGRTAATPRDEANAIEIVKERLRSVTDGIPHEPGDPRDRFHLLLSRYVVSLRAIQDRFARAAQLPGLDEQITRLQTELRGLTGDARAYATVLRDLRAARATRAATARDVAPVYQDLGPEVTASPFVATSLNADRAGEYALGLRMVPPGKVARTVGRVGRIIVLVASKAQLVADGTYTIADLARTGAIRIRANYSENELTFGGSIPGEYVKATLEVDATQAPTTVGASAKGRAAAEGARFGGLDR